MDNADNIIPIPDHLTMGEVQRRLNAFTPADWMYLKKAARYHAQNDLDPDDLQNEAIWLAMETKRECPRDVELRTFLNNSMRSIAYALRSKKKRRKTDQLDEPVAEADEEALDVGMSVLSAEEMLIEHETGIENEELYQKLMELFKDDQVALNIFEGLKEGFEREEICELYSMTKTEYDSKRKAIRRKLDEHFGKGERL